MTVAGAVGGGWNDRENRTARPAEAPSATAEAGLEGPLTIQARHVSMFPGRSEKCLGRL